MTRPEGLEGIGEAIRHIIAARIARLRELEYVDEEEDEAWECNAGVSLESERGKESSWLDGEVRDGAIP